MERKGGTGWKDLKRPWSTFSMDIWAKRDDYADCSYFIYSDNCRTKRFMEYKVSNNAFLSIDGHCLIKFKGLWPAVLQKFFPLNFNPKYPQIIINLWSEQDSWTNFQFIVYYIIQSSINVYPSHVVLSLSCKIKLIYSQCGFRYPTFYPIPSKEKNKNDLFMIQWYIMCHLV